MRIAITSSDYLNIKEEKLIFTVRNVASSFERYHQITVSLTQEWSEINLQGKEKQLHVSFIRVRRSRELDSKEGFIYSTRYCNINQILLTAHVNVRTRSKKI